MENVKILLILSHVMSLTEEFAGHNAPSPAVRR